MFATIAVTVVAIAWIMIGLSASVIGGRPALKGSCGGIAGTKCPCGKEPGDQCSLDGAA